MLPALVLLLSQFLTEARRENSGWQSKKTNAQDSKDPTDHLTGTRHWVYIAVTDRRESYDTPPERLRDAGKFIRLRLVREPAFSGFLDLNINEDVVDFEFCLAKHLGEAETFT